MPPELFTGGASADARFPMFRGTHEAKIDDKGRLKLPADFMKLVVEKNYGPTFFITSRDGKVAEVWPMPEWEMEEEKKVFFVYREIKI